MQRIGFRLTTLTTALILPGFCVGATLPSIIAPLPPVEYEIRMLSLSALANSQLDGVVTVVDTEPLRGDFALEQFVDKPIGLFGAVIALARFDRVSTTAWLSMSADPADDRNGMFVSLYAQTRYSGIVFPRPGAPAHITHVPYQMTAAASVVCGESFISQDALLFQSATAGVHVAGLYNRQVDCNTSETSFEETSLLLLPVLEPFDVAKWAGGNVTGGLSASGSLEGRIEAYADPTFVIDPSFEYANYFDIAFSGSPVQPVPEPSTFAAFAFGLAALTGLVRNR